MVRAVLSPRRAVLIVLFAACSGGNHAATDGAPVIDAAPVVPDSPVATEMTCKTLAPLPSGTCS